MSILKLENVCFSYDKAPVLNNINYEFEKGKVYAIVGKSGAGKTTLLSVLSGLASPNSGNILYNGDNIKSIDKYAFRSKYVGVVFQNYNLLSKLTALENVILSIDIAGINVENKKKYAYELLKNVDLDDDETNRRVLKLSGGQQQRVAIARALSYNPEIILADEPTGNLDEETGNQILDILSDLAKAGKCVIIVTHSPDIAKKADFVYKLTKDSA